LPGDPRRGRLIMPLVAFLAAAVAALLPRRYWPAVERRGLAVGDAAAFSALVTTVAAGIAGARAFFAHAAASAAAADQILVRVAATQIVASNAPDVTSRLAEAISAASALAFLLTPVGALTVYLTGSGACRLLGWYLDEPFGDPFLTLADAAGRRLLRRAGAARDTIRQRRAYGPVVADSVATGAAVGLPGADVVVVASRPKPEWTPGAMVVSSDGCYLLGAPVQQRFGRHERLCYPLVRKTDAAIVRRSIRYDLRSPGLATARRS
jgi:hypothetical protein